MRTSSTKNSLIIGISIVLGASLLSAGISNAAGSTIKACAKKSTGAMRLIASAKKCKSSERTLSWGTKGAAGPSGISFATYTTNGIPGILRSDPAPYTVASLDNLVFGNYLMQATFEMEEFQDFVGNISCRFLIDISEIGFMSSPFSYIEFRDGDEVQSGNVTYALEDLPGGDYDKIDLQCYVQGAGEFIVGDLIMSATKVTTLQRQDLVQIG